MTDKFSLSELQKLSEAAKEATSGVYFDHLSWTKFQSKLSPDTILALVRVALAAAEVFDDAEFIAAYKVTGNIETTRAYKDLKEALKAVGE